jgi:hypothetical protein
MRKIYTPSTKNIANPAPRRCREKPAKKTFWAFEGRLNRYQAARIFSRIAMPRNIL